MIESDVMPDMRINIYDYCGNRRTIILREELVDSLFISVISGDEELTVLYKDGRVEVFDSCLDRREDYFDGRYCIYNRNIDFTNYEEFANSTDVYNRLHAIRKLIREINNECKES